MPGTSSESVVHETLLVRAPLERCFALSTRVDLVKRTLGMQLVGGVTSGHITAGSRVVWKGWKFGLPTEHHTLITGFAAPHLEDGRLIASFEDSQEKGRFAAFRHEHFFRETPEGTQLEDCVHFRLPFGVLGRLAARFILGPHIRKLARQRFQMIRALAEGEGWRQFVTTPTA